MMNHMSGGGPSLPHSSHPHPSRRQQEYHYHHPHAQPLPYSAYHHPSHYHGPPMHPYAQQWYQPYPHYAPPTPRHFQQQASPIVVSSHPNSQPVVPLSRYPPQPLQQPQPSRQPQPEPQNTPSLASQPAVTPSTTPTTNSVNAGTPPIPLSSEPVQDRASIATLTQEPFQPPLPWFSVPESSFPPKILKRRRKRKPNQVPSNTLELPVRQKNDHSKSMSTQTGEVEQQPSLGESAETTLPMDSETPQTSLAPSETPSTDPTTPSSIQPTAVPNAAPTQPPKRTTTKPVIPIVPITPLVPNITSPRQKAVNQIVPTGEKTPTAEAVPVPDEIKGGDAISTVESNDALALPSAARRPPQSWAELLRSKGPATNGNLVGPGSNVLATSSPVVPKSESLSDTLRIYNVGSEGKLSFIEPRGLVNTGNMCYMNSILQTLVFCVPFYEFLDQIGKRAAHSFKSDTPLIDAMIMFIREFNIIDSAPSVEQLRLRLKDNDLEQYGEPFVPEYVYDVIKRLPRFSTMRRGHQQDAEEFLGFLLEGLHDECAQIMQGSSIESALTSTEKSGSSLNENSTNASSPAEGGWLEVGPKQKPSVTRSSGASVESPITKIFGGKLRSEFRVPGLKNSVTLEPYQPLQLDIGDPNVHNITDALKGLTRSETLHGEFNSPRGPGINAIKQVFIETLPPVLILHLKRFQYETSGTQKIWKKIGYPLELEIPKEVFPQQRRNKFAANPAGLPKYRLIGVVYHHGKSAAGGHYTVDIRRQEGREWVRFDDTLVRRVRSEDVASEGGEEDPQALKAALEDHKRDVSAGNNIYKQVGFFDDADSEPAEEDQGGWSQVNGSNATSPTQSSSKRFSGVANGGTSTPSTAGKQTPRESKFSIKDNKVAYILLYEQIQP